MYFYNLQVSGDVGAYNHGVKVHGGDVWKQFNLKGFPPVFYRENTERGLVVKQSGNYVPNPIADPCHKILEYLKKEHAYDNKMPGKIAESHFSGLGYG